MKTKHFFVIGYTLPEKSEEAVVNTTFELLPSFLSGCTRNKTISENHNLYVPNNKPRKIHLIFCIVNEKPVLKKGVRQDFLLLLEKDRIKQTISKLREDSKIDPTKNYKQIFGKKKVIGEITCDLVGMATNTKFAKGFSEIVAIENIPKELVLCMRLYAWCGNKKTFDKVFGYYGAIKVLPYLRIDNNQPQVNLRLELSPNATQEDILNQASAIKHLEKVIKGGHYSRDKKNFDDDLEFLKIDDDKYRSDNEITWSKGYEAIDKLPGLKKSSGTEQQKLARVRAKRHRKKRS